MNFADPILNTVDSTLAWFAALTKQPAWAFCDVETADDDHSLVTHDGSLLGVLRMNGVRRLVGQAEFEQMVERLSAMLNSHLGDRGHTVQVHFMRDPDPVNVEQALRERLATSWETARRLSLSLDDVLSERVKHLTHYCAIEQVHLVLWTSTAGMSKAEMKRVSREKSTHFKRHPVPPAVDAQDLFAVMREFRERHAAFVRAVMSELEIAEIDVTLLEVHQALRVMRSFIDPEWTAYDWSPSLPGDRIPVRDKLDASSVGRGDVSHLLWPPLSRQLFPRDAEVLNMRMVQVGDRIYAPVHIDLFPKEAPRFIALFTRILDNNLPFRMSYVFDGGGTRSFAMKSMIESILSFAHVHNRMYNAAIDQLKEIEKGEKVLRLRVSLATWAPAGQEDLLKSRASQLARVVESWGQCEVAELSGDTLEGYVSSLLAVTPKSIATPALAPAAEVVAMLPIDRPSSPWESGAVLWRSQDGKVWPYQPGSSKQTTWIDLVFARPGSGKSVWLDMTNLALCLSPGLRGLPYIGIIDIGPSSSGLISLLRDALPPAKRHQVAYHRLRMTADYAINPFDTQLGARFPLPVERAFLVNFLTLLATPVGKSTSYDGMADMIGMVVDEVYRAFSDDAEPKRFVAHMDEDVDRAIAESGIKVDEQSTWWEIVDALFRAGHVHEAVLAQRYAMPLIADLVSMSRMSAVRDIYGKVTVPTGESLIDAFNRMISSAARDFPVLSTYTRFDLGDARVVSLDLDEVAKGTGDAARRQTAVMYMLARYVVARSFYMSLDDVALLPQDYRDHHRSRLLALAEVPKRLCYDEFHRTAGLDAVRQQVVIDMREGRKWGVIVTLLSQRLEDFGSDMVEMATSIFVMDAGPLSTVENVARTFGLDETATQALMREVHGPTRDGATFLGIFSTKKSRIVQLVTSTIGPIEMWAYSTTSEDMTLRRLVTAGLGSAEARRVLARRFPHGSAKEEIERRRGQMRERAGVVTEDQEAGMIEALAQEIIREETTGKRVA